MYALTPANLGQMLTCVATPACRLRRIGASAEADSSIVRRRLRRVPMRSSVSGKGAGAGTITAAVDVVEGAAVTWQWFADGSPIAGVTGPAFRPTVAQLGQRLTARASVAVAGYEQPRHRRRRPPRR